MPPIKLALSGENTRLTLSLGGASAELDAAAVDKLVRDLAARRAQMTPIHPAEPPDDAARVHQSDNLLWRVQADPNRAAIQFATQHPGLGWSAMLLSRAQAEDLQVSIDFALLKIPDNR